MVSIDFYFALFKTSAAKRQKWLRWYYVIAVASCLAGALYESMQETAPGTMPSAGGFDAFVRAHLGKWGIVALFGVVGFVYLALAIRSFRTQKLARTMKEREL